MELKENRGLLVLLPSLRISGGVQETLRLASAVAERGVPVQILVFWKHAHESADFDLPTEYLSNFAPRKAQALREFPVLLFRYLRWTRRLGRKGGINRPAILLTHFSTFPFAWLSPRLRRFCFNQDVEWMFVPAGPLRMLVRWLILFTSRRSRVITTNAFISNKYLECGVKPFAQASIWASSFWMAETIQNERPLDVVMLLRQGAVKRPELYMELIQFLHKNAIRCAVVTPENELYEQVNGLVELALLRPDNQEIQNLYKKCKIFVLLSETEGFGLPPLEAMGSGCVPFCRDSGGVRVYMQGPLAANLVPLEESVSQILERLKVLLMNTEALGHLSMTAYQLFADGLRNSRAEREACFDRTAEDLLK